MQNIDNYFKNSVSWKLTKVMSNTLKSSVFNRVNKLNTVVSDLKVNLCVTCFHMYRYIILFPLDPNCLHTSNLTI